jgi:hypothetical protein
MWMDNIKMDLVDSMGLYGIEWCCSGQGLAEGSCEHRIAFGSIKC